jgi:hypothetical protein
MALNTSLTTTTMRRNEMDKQDYMDLNRALSLLHDFISNHGAKAEDYKILESAEDVLKGYVSVGGETNGNTL